MRTAQLLAILTVVVLAVAVPAHAALWLELDPTAAAPGATVTGRTFGDGALANEAGRDLDLYLLPAVRYGQVERDDRGVRGVPQLPDELPADAVAAGVLAVDEAGNGHTEFVVPDVPAGEHLIALHCPDCPRLAPLLTVESLTVLATVDGELAATGTPPLRLATVALLLFGGAAVVVGAGPSVRTSRPGSHERVPATGRRLWWRRSG